MKKNTLGISNMVVLVRRKTEFIIKWFLKLNTAVNYEPFWRINQFIPTIVNQLNT